MEKFRHPSRLGDTAQDWAGIVHFYAELEQGNPVFAPLASLARQLASSPFTRAGLCALTSMHDLVLGPSTV